MFSRNAYGLLGLLLLCGGLLSSCEMDLSTTQTATVPVKINLQRSAIAGTKLAADTERETVIRSVDILVYDQQSGLLDNAQHFDSEPYELTVSEGQRVFYVVANHENPSFFNQYAVKTASGLEGLTTSALDSSAPKDEMVMAGKVTANISQPVELNVPLYRRYAKIQIDEIVNLLPEDEVGAVTLKGIFIENIVATAYLFSSKIPFTQWLNCRGRDLLDYGHLYDGNLNYTIPSGGSYKKTHCFYCCPNTTILDCTAEEWCARYSRLVVWIQIKGVDNYYPINLHSPVITADNGPEPNTLYQFTKVKLLHYGSPDPDKPVTVNPIEFDVTVSTWDNEQQVININ